MSRLYFREFLEEDDEIDDYLNRQKTLRDFVEELSTSEECMKNIVEGKKIHYGW
jgi:hypothetical protein